LKFSAAFKNNDMRESILRERNPAAYALAGEADLGDPLAYGFNYTGAFDIGYFDPTDSRIRLFEGGTGKQAQATKDDIKAKYAELRRIYRARQPTEIPTEPGVCTPYGFFKDPADGPVKSYTIDVAVRSLKYPNLIIFVTSTPAAEDGPKSVDELRDPNKVTMEDIQSIKGMGAIAAIAGLANIKRTLGPETITIAGQAGRLIAREYHHNGTLDSSGSGAAYEFQAEVVGVPGQADKPAITIKLAAALPDPFPYPPPVKGGFGKIHHYKPSRPALKGVKTPPFDEAMVYFKQVVASVRPLAGGAPDKP
jgi:hypothetical protein